MNILVLDKTIHDVQSHEYEIEANIFAANLILPINVFMSQIARGYYSRKISAISQVLKQVIEIRIIEIPQRGFLLSDAYVSFVLRDYLNANNRDEVKHTILYELFNIYNLFLNQEGYRIFDYFKASTEFADIAENSVSEYTSKIIDKWRK